MKKIINKELIIQIFKFGIVGFIAFIIDYGLMCLLKEVFLIHYLIASIISFTVSVIFNYIMSTKWVFSLNKKQTTKDFIIFIILSVIGLILNSIIMYVTVTLISIDYKISKLIATFLVMVYNFITRKIFVEGR